MKFTAPIIRRSLAREREKLLPGAVVSFTRIAHPQAEFGSRSRMIGLIELENGKRVLAPLLADTPFIGQRVSPRMRLSHVTGEGLRVYEVAYEAGVQKPIPVQDFPGYILALTGPSGVGKSTISKMLANACSDYAAKVPILTTRGRKSGDDGEYIYTNTKEFDRMKRDGAIVAMAQIPSSSENRQYGYRAADIEAIWKKGKLPVVVTEKNLLEDLARHYGRRSILSCGLLPPGRSKRAMLSQLLHRLRTRGRETEAHIQDRLKNAEHDLAFFTERSDLFDHIVINSDLSSIVDVLKKKIPALSGV